MKFSREFSMPSGETFSIPPIRRLLDRWIPRTGKSIVVDPFARNNTWANVTNDLDPNTIAQSHLPAEDFVSLLNVSADVVLFDPPYSVRQISEIYNRVGIECGMKETQSGRMYKNVKDGLDSSLKEGGIAICFGWNSMGFGLNRGYDMEEILLISHGGAHNDTIVTVERKRFSEPTLFGVGG